MAAPGFLTAADMEIAWNASRLTRERKNEEQMEDDNSIRIDFYHPFDLRL
jgi:hypothetical protein